MLHVVVFDEGYRRRLSHGRQPRDFRKRAVESFELRAYRR